MARHLYTAVFGAKNMFFSFRRPRLIAILVTLIVTLTFSYQGIHQYEPKSIPIPEFISQFHSGQVADENAVLYEHNTWSKLSVKPVAYVFPQFYAFPENDKIWGINFTEWENVKKATHNVLGLETLRPHESIGYYDGLALETRKRQGKFLRDSGFYGAVFHHYWFEDRPVMDSILQAMLLDGQPDIPFMLSWANEPWTARWDGVDSSQTFLRQSYGLVDNWRLHFQWLLPFFRHPNYIRSDGRLQFIVYRPSHLGKAAPAMYTAWKEWAMEAGLGGLDIIETAFGPGSDSEHPPDAVNEFQPHAGGSDYAKYGNSHKSAMVYHRGMVVCWDSTPRHTLDPHLAFPMPLCHPESWKWSTVEVIRRIKENPNPAGSENFLFVNALNEWGEGNVLEPSAQFGDAYGHAFKEALQIAEERHIWQKDFILQQGMVNNATRWREKKGTAPDVCVLVAASYAHRDDQIYKLPAVFASLQAQTNPNWRAIMYQYDTEKFGSETLAFRALDTRIAVADIPEKVKSYNTSAEARYPALDWVLQKLDSIDEGCAQAKYLLFADGLNTFLPHAFDVVADERKPEYDMYGLSIESRRSLKDAELKAGVDLVWHERCSRLLKTEQSCMPASATGLNFDISGTLFHLPKFMSWNITFTGLLHPRLLIDHLTTTAGWEYFVPPTNGTSCDMLRNPTYGSCVTTGGFWFDSPRLNETGCYTQDSFRERFGVDRNYIDILYYRRNGRCIRYTSTEYNKVLAASKVEAKLERKEEMIKLGVWTVEDARKDWEETEAEEIAASKLKVEESKKGGKVSVSEEELRGWDELMKAKEVEPWKSPSADKELQEFSEMMEMERAKKMEATAKKLDLEKETKEKEMKEKEMKEKEMKEKEMKEKEEKEKEEKERIEMERIEKETKEKEMMEKEEKEEKERTEKERIEKETKEKEIQEKET